METEMHSDIGEEIIFKLRQIISKLDRIIKNNEEKFPNPSLAGD
jgi:hypothetical protein